MFNPLLALAQWMQDTPFRLTLSQSTWGVPIIAAIHVLAIAWFAGAVLLPGSLPRRFRWFGLSILLLTGALLFWSQPLRLYYSGFFRLKMLLLMAIALHSLLRAPARILSILLWAATIFASRGIAYR